MAKLFTNLFSPLEAAFSQLQCKSAAFRLCLIRPAVSHTVSSLHRLCSSNSSWQVCQDNIPSVSQSKYIVRKLHSSSNLTSSEGTKAFSTAQAVLYADDSSGDQCTDLVERINTQLSGHDTGRLFAIVHLDGNQRKITTEDILLFQRNLEADIGERIVLNKVLLVGGKDFSLVGRPVLSPSLVRVEATVIEKTLTHTMIHYVYRRRKNYRRFNLIKRPLTYVRINSIQLNPLENP